MFRVLALTALAAGLVGLMLVIFTSADAQVQARSVVVLQPTTPGQPQAGNANLGGKLIAGEFQGGGSGLTSVDADLLDGLDSSAFLQTIPLPFAGNTSTPNAGFQIINAGSGPGLAGESDSGIGVFGHATAGTGSTYGVYGLNNSNGGIGVLGTSQASSGVNYGGYFVSNSNFGIGVFGQGGVGVEAEGTVVGVNALSTAHLGRGVWGRATGAGATGVAGEVSSTSGEGVYGHASADTGFTHGVYGLSDSVSGIGVLGTAQAFSGVNYGLYGVTNSTEGRGVFGHATSGSGFTFGAYGLSSSPDGIGVLGTAEHSSGINYGVIGVTNSGANGWGVYSYGRLGATGVKAFRIDHPLDPENKWLLHYCSEGPEPLNVYSGEIRTDAKGFATIELPDYFEEVNRNPRVQLTVDDSSEDFVMAKVVGGVNDGACRVRTSKPHVRVYWEVKAVRNDRWMQKYGAPVEREKVEHERGKYQHPELYGLPPEMGMNFKRDVRAK